MSRPSELVSAGPEGMDRLGERVVDALIDQLDVDGRALEELSPLAHATLVLRMDRRAVSGYPTDLLDALRTWQDVAYYVARKAEAWE